MKFRSCWLIFSLIGLSLTSCGQQKSSQEIAETVKNSIVLISYQNEGGHGTGFIVPGPTGVCTVLTARHVVEGRSLNLQTNDQKLWKTNSIQAMKIPKGIGGKSWREIGDMIGEILKGAVEMAIEYRENPDRFWFRIKLTFGTLGVIGVVCWVAHVCGSDKPDL